MAEYNGKIDLLNRAQSGDQDAVADLFRQCRADIYFYAFEVLENEEAAQTVTRDTLYMMCRETTVPATAADFTPWMLFICHRCCKSYLPQNVKKEMPQPVAVPETDYVSVDAEDNGVLPTEARNRLMAGLQVLSIEERAIIVLLYYENLPLKTAAQVMGYHPTLAEAYRSQALRALKAAVMSGASAGIMGGCSLKKTLWWIFSALHKNVKCDALPIYENLCAAMNITPKEAVVREITGINTVKEPVKQQQLKMSLKDRIEWWPRSVKIGLVCLLAAIVLGGGFFAVTLLKDGDKGLTTSEVSEEDWDDDDFEEEDEESTDGTTQTTKKKTTTTARQRDEYGNRVVNGTTAPTTAAVQGRRRPRSNNNGSGGNNSNGYVNNDSGNGGNGGGDENLYRTTAGRTRSNNNSGNNNSGGNNSGGNNSGGNNSGSSGRPKPNVSGGYDSYRPATPTSDQGTKKTGGLSEGNYKYALYSNGCVHITGFSGSGSVTVPGTLGGYKVTAIDPSAFAGNGITSITLPSSVEIISDNAFKGCTSLSSVTMKGVISIGMYAFDGCSRLSSVSASNTLKRIGSSAFRRCTALSSFSIPTSVISIEAQAFNECTALTDIKIPSGVKFIENNVFRSCSSLRSVTIPASITQIGDGAFYGCSSLKTVYYGGSASQWATLPFDETLNKPLTTANIVY